MNIANIIKEELMKSRKQAAQIAREAGIHESSLSRIKSGERNLNRRTIEALLTYFGYVIVKKKGKR